MTTTSSTLPTLPKHAAQARAEGFRPKLTFEERASLTHDMPANARRATGVWDRARHEERYTHFDRLTLFSPRVKQQMAAHFKAFTFPGNQQYLNFESWFADKPDQKPRRPVKLEIGCGWGQ